MNGFRIHTEETAGARAGRILGDVRNKLGFVPNIFAVFAESLPALEANVAMKGQLARTSLTPTERELVQMVTSIENRCAYCVAGHTAFAEMQKLPSEVFEAARNGRPIPNDRLETLRRFTRDLVRQRGHLDGAQVDAFHRAGYSPEQLLEVILAVCIKMFANLTNNIIGLPLDDRFQAHAWSPSPVNSETITTRVA